MLTIIAILICMILFVSVIGMICQLANGSFFAWVWWMGGGCEACLELIGAILVAIFKQD